MEIQGKAWHGMACQGKARKGNSSKGKARLGKQGKERKGQTLVTYFVVYAPSSWHLAHSSMELDTLEFTHVEWLHACTFLEGTFHVDTWNLNCLDAYFLW
jgi:hypothetical protein